MIPAGGRARARSLRVLHAGCGDAPLPEWILLSDRDSIVETRLDIDPGVHPDVVASMADMGDIGPFDMVTSNHALEHLYPHEVVPALREMRRVLADGGHVVLTVPDLEGVSATMDVLYESPSGPISGLDMLYGQHDRVAENPAMAHHSGFTRETLWQALKDAGFSYTFVRRFHDHNLLGVGVR